MDDYLDVDELLHPVSAVLMNQSSRKSRVELSIRERCKTPLYGRIVPNDHAARAIFIQLGIASEGDPAQYDHAREVSRISLE